MLSTPSTDSATKEQSGSDSCSAKPIKEVKNLNGPDAKISCPCRSSLSTESMIQVCTFALIRTIYKCFSQYCLFHSLIFFFYISLYECRTIPAFIANCIQIVMMLFFVFLEFRFLLLKWRL